jgi:Glycosyl transferase family 2
LFRFDDPSDRLDVAGIADFASEGGGLSRPVAIAIPVKDESERLAKCLAALARQKDEHGRPLDPKDYRVVVFANNCSDDSAHLARALAGQLGLHLRVIEACLPTPEAHAGNARREAMDCAESWLSRNGARTGVILTTDADSQVPPSWIANNLAAIEAGADAVLGRVDLDEEGALLPPALHRRGQLEGDYETLLTELSARLDPVDFNPWPHHATISGASLAVTREAYLRVGGLPRVPLGEDKAFVAELFRCDARIRFSPDVLVTTSGRLRGRAPGGVADTLRLRCTDLDAACDEALEPFRVAMKRAKWRGRTRRLYRSGRLIRGLEWAETLGISASHARRASQAPTFGSAWSAIEAASPLLARRSLAPTELPDQISGARRAVKRLRNNALPPGQNIEPELGISITADDEHCIGDGSDEELCGVIAT